MSEEGLIINNISKGFGEVWDREEIISDFSLNVKQSELTVLVGPSGCVNQL